MAISVKICGLKTEDAVDAAVEGGAAYLGAVFFPPSPRAVTAFQAAELFEFVPEEVQKVGLFVDPDDALLASVLTHVRLDILQLHGQELPGRVDRLRLDWGLPVMKALPIAEAADISAARAYDGIADFLLFDAKPPKGATRPGGNAVAFEWSLLHGTQWQSPWMLAGGLTAENLAEAVRASGATTVDVSSGVETAPGEKSPEKIRAFLDLAAEL
ncbi:MAG: phosphoribosylanthranilate isomerase [Magnetospiraceae bacterium]